MSADRVPPRHRVRSWGAARWRRAVRLLAAPALIATALVAVPAPGEAVVDNPDTDTSAAYRYVVDPEAGEVEVTIELTFTADKPNRTTSTGYFQYYFDGTGLIIPAEVGDLTVTDRAGRELRYEIDDSVEEVSQLLIDFRSNVFFRQSTDVIVSFTLPGGQARGDELTRVNGAYAAFEAWVDPWLEAATVTVVTPEGFVDRSTGSDGFRRPVTETTDDGDDVLVFEAIDVDPELYWSAVSLARDENLVTTEVEVDEIDVDILAWPGDERWTRFVTENLETGLPILIDEVGLEWPVDDDLTIIESYTPYLLGYAGWYDLVTDEIEIGDELDTHVIFHELSHVWFNGQLFDERWITEGLADEFGAEVVEAVGEERPLPPTTRATDPIGEPLNRWSVETEDVELERWAYSASWTVTRAIADEVGMDVLASAVRSASNDEIPYVGDGLPEGEVRRNDWRLYLDLLENQGSVTDGAIADLFAEWVLAPSQADDLEDRAASRDRYLDLGDRGRAWAPPLAVRSAMSSWRFELADELMADADAILDTRAETESVLDGLAESLPVDADVALPAQLETTYEEAEDDLVSSTDLTDDALAAAERLATTGRSIDGATGILQRIGAIGADHRGDLALAAERFTDGELADAVDGADEIDDRVEDLTRQGLIRVGIGLALVVMLVGLVLWRRRAGRRRRASSSDPAGPATSGNGDGDGSESVPALAAGPVALLPAGEVPAVRGDDPDGGDAEPEPGGDPPDAAAAEPRPSTPALDAD